MNDLLFNLDKLKTTELGAGRIKRNLDLKTDDIVGWCKKCIENADSLIRQGKNWYCCYKGFEITINATSFTVITAHKINPKNSHYGKS